MTEAAQYQEAAATFAASPNNAASIETMMRLSLEGVNPTLRLWAKSWLDEKCNITVGDEQGSDHATPPTAANLR